MLIALWMAWVPASAFEWGAPITIDTIIEVNTVHAADLDGDGDADLMVGTGALGGNGDARWYENLGAGKFAALQLIDNRRTSWVQSGDPDGDGDLDIITVSGGDLFSGEDLVLYENLGNGVLGPATVFLLGDDIPTTTAWFSDLDGDGALDLVQGGHQSANWYRGTGVDLGFGTGTWLGGVYGASAIRPVDLDLDGAIDILAGDESYVAVLPALEMWVNDGSGRFPTEIDIGGIGGEVHTADAADLDGDGDIDVVADRSAYFGWYRNQGTDFDPRIDLAPSPWYLRTDAIDLDADGDVDLIATSRTETHVYENDGAGNFGPPVIVASGLTGDHEVVDLDEDGLPDLVVGGYGLRWAPSAASTSEPTDTGVAPTQSDPGSTDDPRTPSAGTDDSGVTESSGSCGCGHASGTAPTWVLFAIFLMHSRTPRPRRATAQRVSPRAG